MTEHYFTKKPNSRLEEQRIEFTVNGKKIQLISSSGLFSKDKVDKGSMLLIDSSDIKDGDSILDLGCGYGAVGIGIYNRYRLNKIVFSDINERAVNITNKNCKLHRLDNYKVIQSDSFENIKEDFDVILLNPPQTAGKELCFRMIEESRDHLNKGGSLQIVARHNKGGKTLSEKMESVFGNVSATAKSGGYRVYITRK
jgi:16S rRNA (guanine1207-N2)-methyltransferase